MVCVAGCGRIGFDATGGANADDSGIDSRTDAAGDSGLVPLGPFGPPSVVAALANPAEDDEPTLTADMLEIIFESRRGAGDLNLWVSTRASVTAPWSVPAPIGERDLYRASRPDVGSPWGPPAPITELNTPVDDVGPSFAGGDLELYFASGPTGNRDLYVATRSAVGQPFGPRMALASLNS